jgi:hypothetical protein
MASKQPTSQTTATGAASAPVARSRVRTAKHKITTPSEPISAAVAALKANDDPLEVISGLAYGYWEARGRQEGHSLADWVRAEEEYRRRLG